MTQTIFGPRIGAWDVEEAVLSRLRERLATYTREVALRRGFTAGQLWSGVGPADGDRVPIRPRLIVRRAQFSGWPKTALPYVQVVVPGMDDVPRRDDDGVYTTWWTANVFCVVAARDHASTRLLRSIYEDAIPWAILQGRTLDGFASSTEWIAEASDDVPLEEESERTLQGVVQVFRVEVAGCLDPHAGPAVFLPDDETPPADYGPDVTVSVVELDYAGEA